MSAYARWNERIGIGMRRKRKRRPFRLIVTSDLSTRGAAEGSQLLEQHLVSFRANFRSGAGRDLACDYNPKWGRVC
jgi:hypothetical protein